MAVITGDAVARRLRPPPLTGPPRGPAATLTNAANNIRDITAGGPARQAGVPVTPGYGSYRYNPDPALRQSYVYGQPGVQSALYNQVYGGGIAADQARQSAEQALIAYGDPNLARQFGGLVDPQTASLAEAATHPVAGGWGNSTLAQLQFAAQDAKENAIAHLLSRGQYDSGQLPYELQKESMAYSKNVSDAAQGVYDKIYGYNQNLLTTNLGLAKGVQDALGTAFTNAANHPERYQMPGPSNVTVGGTRGIAAPSQGPGVVPTSQGTGYQGTGGYGGWSYPKTLGPGSYQNMAGAGRPNYQPVGAAAPTQPGYRPIAARNTSGAGVPAAPTGTP